MASKRILIVEDESSQRESLSFSLVLRGFEVASAQDAGTVRRLVDQVDDVFDVVILDMNLNESQSQPLTGADLGIELRQRWVSWPPEFIINSAYSSEMYFRLALSLGAAVYLDKHRSDIDSIIRHVRALALKHSLSIQNPEVTDLIQEIVAESRSREESVLRFCNEFMHQELASCIGAPFLLLLTDARGSYGVSNHPAFTRGRQPVYATIQALVETVGTHHALEFNGDWLRELDAPLVDPGLLTHLQAAAFVPLLANGELRLSLGILRDKQHPLAEDATALADVLATYLTHSVSALVLTILSEWNEAFSLRKAAVLAATSGFCLYLGQEQLALLKAAEDAGELPDEAGAYLGKLRLLAEDLRATGETLNDLFAASSRAEGSSRDSPPQGVTVSMATVIRDAWSEVSRILEPEQRNVLRLEGDCSVIGSQDYLSVAASRVLQWFAQRMVDSPPDSGPSISVCCRETSERSEIAFEDRSRRSPGRHGPYLFMPFPQSSFRPPLRSDLKGPGIHMPLYMAKVLIEVGHSGRLLDRTDELVGEYGHRFVMSFSKPYAHEA